MSYRPNPFGPNEPTGVVVGPLLSPQSYLLQLARFTPISSPQLYFVVVPARAAYSHSASVARRYAPPVSEDSQRT